MSQKTSTFDADEYDRFTNQLDRVTAGKYKSRYHWLWWLSKGAVSLKLMIAMLILIFAAMPSPTGADPVWFNWWFNLLDFLNSHQDFILTRVFFVVTIVGGIATFFQLWSPEVSWTSYRAAAELLKSKRLMYLFKNKLFRDDEPFQSAGQDELESLGAWFNYVKRHAGGVDLLELRHGESKPDWKTKIVSTVFVFFEMIVFGAMLLFVSPVVALFRLVSWPIRFALKKRDKPKSEPGIDMSERISPGNVAVFKQRAIDRVAGQSHWFAKRYRQKAKLFLGLQMLVLVTFFAGAFVESYYPVATTSFALIALTTTFVFMLMEYRDFLRCDQLMYQYRRSHKRLKRLLEEFEKESVQADPAKEMARVQTFMHEGEQIINEDVDRWALR